MIWLFDALAHIPFARGDYVETERLLKEQVEYAKTNLHKGHPWVVGSLNHYATVVLDNHGPARAEPICREALAVARENGGNVVPPLRALAHVRRKLKDYEEARKLYSEALAIRRQRNGNKHASVAESARELGMVLYEAHRFEEAEASLQESFAIYSSTLGLENTTTSSVAKDITNLYEDWNRPEDASIWREKSTATTNGKSIQLGG